MQSTVKQLYLRLAACVWILALLSVTLHGQIVRLPPAQVTIDEDILASFVDEPCHHFERARDRFLAGDTKAAAHELRTAAAFLELEAARATAAGSMALEASVNDLERLAGGVETAEVRSVDVLQRAFAGAHRALACHHCIKTAHECCRPATFLDKVAMARAGEDLQASVIHLKQAAQWSGEALDVETLKALDASERVSAKLINKQDTARQETFRTIRLLGKRLEAITGRTIMIAPPLTDDNRLAPSIFQ